ncbi:MAG: Non-canonical purine NTP pyrophosphatase [Candidatus Uhrbacteria bacterium GW2011_GWF2_41_16]|jgi:XTP/dITP diphosphohydrolase|uniref:dITP/XTP pyrophosphatase n=2 Tax=Candidatus Uhriibacteriota TaxID=1752732 RepID=A0A0G0VC35_9BACT|nr:MAG: Non-canonical purine NTP pyrophosphatase [Candidatus Uhrbacteria bacterium GW2011_GWA2_41_10]KKR87504.1 MAG: Non-canonical purine NTP pyrophosphatase [Candidatus Uhrbacteria bacterium GW2011_GWC2_41_11]KKR98484.1 MAG: Non-canonical purine NTP pyrophosphatase [Candidatus Uhrbacteria bacterium GW2011_GWF2_41_16]HBO99980.1 non-canonical purine NTP pyrophosphatase, RdgB/HAM1 family [Candidatus Uhrbacteria bacterium]
MKIIFATHNPGKIEEMRVLLADANIEVASAEEVGVLEDVVEDGETFAENALKKARFVVKQTGHWSVADDSGLCVWALGCLPGVRTARWAGEGASDEKLIEHTLETMKEIPEGKRQAWFESSVALVAPDGEEWVFTGKVSGTISTLPRGSAKIKLPYDVLFVPDGYHQTFAEMSDQEKNQLSHRGRAFTQLKTFLAQYAK